MAGDRPLRVTSSRSENADAFVEAVVDWLGARLDREVRLVLEGDWRSREAALLRGEIDLGLVCSIPYIQHADRLELLAAPVMAGARYGGQPIYFSDVLVLAESPSRRFEDLRGCRWAFNEPDSHSGCCVTRYHLARRGLDRGFFGQVLESGAHQTSLDLLLRGEVEATALDSVVLELELGLRPDLAGRLRVLETFGPSPGPPVVASRSLPEAERAAARRALLAFPAEAPAARRYGLSRFAAVSDGFYDSIRWMAALAEQVVWG